MTGCYATEYRAQCTEYRLNYAFLDEEFLTHNNEKKH